MIEQFVEQAARRSYGDLRVAELTVIGAADTAAELLRHRLHAVADAEDGHARFEYGLGRHRRLHVRDGLGATRQDDAPRAERADVGVTHVPGVDLAVHAAFADASSDQLGVLGPEIEDQDAMRMNVGRAHRGCRRLLS